MRYLGGKHRISRALATQIRARVGACEVWDPFCGGLSMSVALSKAGPVVSSDANPALIALYSAVADGWDPPKTISEAEYHAAKTLPDSNPLKAFAGFCAGFGGKYFGGYARGESRNWAAEGRRALLRDCPGREFFHVDWLAMEPFACKGALYLDPPYAGTTGYAATGAFDSVVFEARVLQWAKLGVPVFVSEYEFPLGTEIWSQQLLKRASVGPGDIATERLFLAGG